MTHSRLRLTRRTGTFAALALLALTAPAAHAQTVVFDNGDPDNVIAYTSDPTSPQFVAETFTFGSAARFDTVEWFGVYFPTNTPPAKDNFTIALYNTDNTGTPNTNPFVTFTPGDAVNRTPTGGNAGDDPIFQYTASLSLPQTLGPGTYGIGIFNDTTNDPDDFWAWATSNQTGTFFFRENESDSYRGTAFPADLSFRLIDSTQVAVIPEPSEWATGGLITGTLLIGMVRARRRKAVPNASAAA